MPRVLPALPGLTRHVGADAAEYGVPIHLRIAPKSMAFSILMFAFLNDVTVLSQTLRGWVAGILLSHQQSKLQLPAILLHSYAAYRIVQSSLHLEEGLFRTIFTGKTFCTPVPHLPRSADSEVWVYSAQNSHFSNNR